MFDGWVLKTLKGGAMGSKEMGRWEKMSWLYIRFCAVGCQLFQRVNGPWLQVKKSNGDVGR